MPAPLLRHAALRSAVAALLVLEALLAVLYVWATITWLFAPYWAVAALALLIAAPVLVRPLWRGRWTSGPWAAAEAIAAFVVGAVHVFVLARAVAGAGEALATRATFATPLADVAFWLLVAAGGALVLAALLVALPVGPTAAVSLAVVPIGVAGLAAGTAAVILAASEDDGCSAFRFDPGRWEEERRTDETSGEPSELERLADALVRCETLVGRDRAAVRRLLGPADTGGRSTWRWYAGLTNDGLGVGDGQELKATVARGRVRRASLAYPLGD
jgi:hypothetical protein